MLVKVTNGNVDTYPYSVGQLRRDNPNTSFPKQIPSEMLESYGVYTVVYTDMPSIDARTQKTEQEAAPTLVDGSWTVGWTTTDKTAEEIQQYDDGVAASNRGKRNNLLEETDYLALTDVTLTADMTIYRQALRDITTHSNWPNLADSDWPTKPE